MPTKVLFTSPARIDAVNIAEYIAQDNTRAGEKFYDSVQQKCDELAEMPKMGKLRNELHPSVRSFPLGRYVISYTIQNDRIIILRILHGARDIPSLF